jgi:hypothetical protein
MRQPLVLHESPGHGGNPRILVGHPHTERHVLRRHKPHGDGRRANSMEFESRNRDRRSGAGRERPVDLPPRAVRAGLESIMTASARGATSGRDVELEVFCHDPKWIMEVEERSLDRLIELASRDKRPTRRSDRHASGGAIQSAGCCRRGSTPFSSPLSPRKARIARRRPALAPIGTSRSSVLARPASSHGHNRPMQKNWRIPWNWQRSCALRHFVQSLISIQSMEKAVVFSLRPTLHRRAPRRKMRDTRLRRCLTDSDGYWSTASQAKRTAKKLR